MSLERWKRLLPVRKIEFIDAASVFRDYGSVWLLLDDLSRALTGESFSEGVEETRRLISRDHLIAALEDCIQLGPSVGSDDLDRKRVEEMISRVRLLDPETMLDLETL